MVIKGRSYKEIISDSLKVTSSIVKSNKDVLSCNILAQCHFGR